MKIKFHQGLLACLLALTFFGCEDRFETRPLHDPIYPSNGQDVEYELRVNANKGIKKVELFTTVSSINSSGTVTAGTESLANTWTVSGNPQSTTVTWTKSGGYSSNKIVDYRFVVTNEDDKTSSHTVTYAIRPYPVNDMPAPVYCQGDPDDVFDCVLIPTTDVTNMNTWRGHVRNIIRNTIHREPTMRFWKRQFNFYINPDQGIAGDYDVCNSGGQCHETPDNYANLSFAETKALMHQVVQRDYACCGGLFSFEMDRPQTFLHENGHSAFRLADEYPNGAHWEEDPYPNNWSPRADAEADTSTYGKGDSDIKLMKDTWYRMCYDTCPMISGPSHFYNFDKPCENRVTFSVLDNAIN